MVIKRCQIEERMHFSKSFLTTDLNLSVSQVTGGIDRPDF
jgi:hypothetical protein